MPLDRDRLLSLDVPARRAVYTDHDVMLYALSVGLGAGAADLPFVYERGLAVVPSFATILAFDDSWLEAGGIDLATVVHGALDITFERPLAPEGAARVTSAITGLTDKGPGRGGIVLQEIAIAQDGVLAATVLSTLFARGGGGFGGSVGREAPVVALPDRPADETLAVPTDVNQALLYRLLGDRNPLHADPAVARAAGFERPILHGACTFGVACATVLAHVCGHEPARLSRFAARFAGPLYPGETLAFSLWTMPDGVGFKAHAAERGTIVLDGGFAAIRPA